MQKKRFTRGDKQTGREGYLWPPPGLPADTVAASLLIGPPSSRSRKYDLNMVIVSAESTTTTTEETWPLARD